MLSSAMPYATLHIQVCTLSALSFAVAAATNWNACLAAPATDEARTNFLLSLLENRSDGQRAIQRELHCWLAAMRFAMEAGADTNGSWEGVHTLRRALTSVPRCAWRLVAVPCMGC